MRFSYYKRPLFLLLLCWVAGILAFRYIPPLSDKNKTYLALRPLPVYGVRLEGRVAEYPVRSRGF